MNTPEENKKMDIQAQVEAAEAHLADLRRQAARGYAFQQPEPAVVTRFNSPYGVAAKKKRPTTA